MSPIDGLIAWLKRRGLPRHILWHHLPIKEGTAATMVAHPDQAIAYLTAEGLLNQEIRMLLKPAPRDRAKAIARLNALIPQDKRNEFATRLVLVERINQDKLKNCLSSIFLTNERLTTIMICQSIQLARPAITKWFNLEQADDVYSFVVTYNKPIGVVYSKQAMTGRKLLVTDKPITSSKLLVVLARDRQLNTIHIKTAYPTI